MRFLPVGLLLSVENNAGSPPTEPVESVAYQQDPDCGESGGDDDDDTQRADEKWAYDRNDAEDARHHAHIRRTLPEDSLEHDDAGQEDSAGEHEDAVDTFQTGS